jgi:prepilin-type N-terminal cleavage/methylation domain-containing protein
MKRRAGFTLAEIAVTIVIVGIGLLLVLQGLNTAKFTAANTRNLKLARDLGLLTLAQIESGLYQDDIDADIVGNYGEEGYPEFMFEVAVGDQTFREKQENDTFDSWAPRDDEKADEEEDEEAVEPFEKVRVRITFPKFGEYKNELELERWMPWKQVYGEAEEDGDAKSTDNKDAGTPPSSTPPPENKK